MARPAAVDHRSAADRQLHWNGHNLFSCVAQRQELSAKTLLRSAAIRVQTPCREQYFFSLLLSVINKAYFYKNPRNIISNIIMIFSINSTRGQTRFLTCVARVTCLVILNHDSQLLFAFTIERFIWDMSNRLVTPRKKPFFFGFFRLQ